MPMWQVFERAQQALAQMPGFSWALALVIGGVFGSYLTCALYRSPRRLSLWAPPSECPQCHTPLGAADLVPVLSWFWRRGRCGFCGVSIPARYVLIEVFSVCLALLAHAVTGAGFLWLPLFGAMLALFFAGWLALAWHRLAWRSVAFALLCLGLYAWVML